MRTTHENGEITADERLGEDAQRERKRWRKAVCVVWLWDYSYRAAEKLMRCVIRQI